MQRFFRQLLPTPRCFSLAMLLAGSALLLAGIPAAHADILFDNGGPNGEDGSYLSSSDPMADNFTLTGPATITAVTFWDLDGLNFSGGLHYTIYSDNSGTPDTSLFSGIASSLVHTATGNSFFGLDEHQNDFSIAPITLGPGTYWLGLSNPDGAGLYWETANDNATYTGMSASTNRNGIRWTDINEQFAFHVNGAASAIPEGSTVALLSLALPMIGVVAVTRRKK